MPFPPPPIVDAAVNPASALSYVLGASGDKAASILRASRLFEGRTVHKVHIRTNTVTTGDTVDVRIETVDQAAGDPSTTLFGTNTNASLVIANGDDNVWKTATLTADADIEPGQEFAIVVVNGASGNMQIAVTMEPGVSGATAAWMYPYGDRFASAAWVKSNRSALIAFIEMNDGLVVPVQGLFGYGPITATTFNNASATDRRGNQITLPMPASCCGCWAFMDADGDCVIELYDSNGTTVLATATIDKDVRPTTGLGAGFYNWDDDGSNAGTIDLSASVAYRLAIRPTSATNLTVYEFNVASAAAMDAFVFGQNMIRSIKTSGTWGQSTTDRTFVGLLLDKFSDGVSSGGGGPLMDGRLIT